MFDTLPASTAKGRRYHLVPSDYEVVAVGAVAVGLTLSKVNASDGVEVYFSSGPVRILMHGTDPTSSVGLEVFDGGSREFSKTPARLLRAIRVGPTNGSMLALYFVASEDP